jgi:hypothetical protein
MDFSQTFHVVKPRYNDIWAALLFLATFAGFVVVLAFAIQGYGATKLFQGGSIYGGASTVGLSTNTIILLQVPPLLGQSLLTISVLSYSQLPSSLV